MTRFSSFAQTLQASDIAELLALTEKPEVISFAGGLPAPELFPIEEMKKVDEAIYNEEGRKAVQYGTTEGYVPLREEICKRMKDKFFVDCKPEDVVVTTGSQQALFILAQILVDKDQTILMESPSYMGAIMAFDPVGPKYTEVPTDDQGIVPEELEKIFVENLEFKNLMVTVLSFGFKYGIPQDADLVFDVRFLPNPYYIEQLRPLSGNDRPVRDYVMGFDLAHEFSDKLEDMIRFLIPNYIAEGKTQLVISVGCTGGKHRSVTLANELYRRLGKSEEYGLRIEHRDIEKDGK